MYNGQTFHCFSIMCHIPTWHSLFIKLKRFLILAMGKELSQLLNMIWTKITSLNVSEYFSGCPTPVPSIDKWTLLNQWLCLFLSRFVDCCFYVLVFRFCVLHLKGTVNKEYQQNFLTISGKRCTFLPFATCSGWWHSQAECSLIRVSQWIMLLARYSVLGSFLSAPPHNFY